MLQTKNQVKRNYNWDKTNKMFSYIHFEVINILPLPSLNSEQVQSDMILIKMLYTSISVD